jgi:hypothetical protein
MVKFHILFLLNTWNLTASSYTVNILSHNSGIPGYHNLDGVCSAIPYNRSQEAAAENYKKIDPSGSSWLSSEAPMVYIRPLF